MTVKPDELKSTLLEKAVGQVRERVDGAQAPILETFVRMYYGDAAPEDLAGLDLYGAALAHWHLLQRRTPGDVKVHAYTPTAEEHGWRSTHSVIDIVSDDMPFIVDSVAMALTRRDTAIHRFIHPAVRVRRDESGNLIELLPWEEEGSAESLVHVEIDRQEQSVLDELAAELKGVLGDVRAAVEDWRAMRARVQQLVSDLAEHPPPVDPDDAAEARAFLEWIDDHNFT